MAIGLKVKFFWYQIGSGDFMFAFFSTVAHNLEKGNWGTRFPVIMNELYQGEIGVEKIDQALEELRTIKEELQKFTPDKVVWDIEDLSKQPPWGDHISSDITDLSNYFVTSEGSDLLSICFQALETAKELRSAVCLKAI